MIWFNFLCQRKWTFIWIFIGFDRAAFYTNNAQLNSVVHHALQQVDRKYCCIYQEPKRLQIIEYFFIINPWCFRLLFIALKLFIIFKHIYQLRMSSRNCNLRNILRYTAKDDKNIYSKDKLLQKDCWKRNKKQIATSWNKITYNESTFYLDTYYVENSVAEEQVYKSFWLFIKLFIQTTKFVQTIAWMS